MLTKRPSLRVVYSWPYAGIYNAEYKLHDPMQGVIMWSINSMTPHRD